MTVRRVMGIENEYGISRPGVPDANPMLMSSQIVTAYARDHGLHSAQTAWDYEFEAPLWDARGFEMDRDIAHPSQLTDEADPLVVNLVLPNGARFYVDHAHPEYSGPEVTDPLDAVVWDRAGDLIASDAARSCTQDPDVGPITLHKNNTDGHGSSYGTHENYLMPRTTPFERIVAGLLPFFASRQVICGSGRVGIGTKSTRAGYQLSQRADFFEAEVGLETTIKRPIVNTRDEPHALVDKYRRLHVIIGDANLADVSTYLKLGTTSLVLGLIESDAVTERIALSDPVQALQTISHDPTLKATVPLEDGRHLTGLDLQWAYLEMVRAWLDDAHGGDPDDRTADVMRRWEAVLTGLGDDPMSVAPQVEWVAKLKLLEGFHQRGVAWHDPKMRHLDIQWTDLRAGKGLFAKVEAAGRIERLVDDATVRAAVDAAPADTRAWFRGRVVEKFGEHLAAASWDSVVFDLPQSRRIHRVGMPEPERGTRDLVEHLLQQATTPEELVDLLG